MESEFTEREPPIFRFQDGTVAADGPLSYLALCADFSADEVRGGLTDPVFIRWDRQGQSDLSIRVPFITGKALLSYKV